MSALRTARRTEGGRMFFEDPEYETWAMRALQHAPFGGAELGECAAAAGRITPGDAQSWKAEWVRVAEQVLGWADAAAAAGHAISASDAYLRAANYLRTATPWLYGRPVSPELRDLVARSNAAFARAMELGPHPATPVEIPFEDGSLPGWLIRAGGPAPRPLLIGTNGYDSLIGEMWFAYGQAAVRRGYDALLFDGPGQGAALTERGLFLRPDWETVVEAVVDFAVEQDGVDPARMALMGWSLGGYLAPRAASGEHRLAAVVADPGLMGMREAMVPLLARFGLDDDQLAHVDELEDDALAPVTEAAQHPPLRWSLLQRGLMVHGVDTIPELMRGLAAYSLTGRAPEIRCPTLLTTAEGDPLSATAEQLRDAIGDHARLVRFQAADGAGGHCEMGARARFQAIAFDWLDEVLA